MGEPKAVSVELWIPRSTLDAIDEIAGRENMIFNAAAARLLDAGIRLYRLTEDRSHAD